MNFPFRFAAANANDILRLNDESANLILAALKASSYTEAQKQRFALLGQQIQPAWINTYTLSADKDATVELGSYDGTTFIPVYPTVLLAAGSNTAFVQFTQGYPIPFGGAVVPALRVVVGTAVILAGHAEFIPNPSERDLSPLTADTGGNLGAGSPNSQLLTLL